MKIARASSSVAAALLLAGLGLVNTPAQAGLQWKWKDPSGAIQYSDRPPPAGTPESSILTRPSNVRKPVNKAAEAASEASATSSAAASAPKNGAESELDAKRKKAEEEKAAKQKAEDEKQAQQRAENCQRARAYQKTLQDGIRIIRPNAKGEREVLDDKGRADEMQRTQESIQANCK